MTEGSMSRGLECGRKIDAGLRRPPILVAVDAVGLDERSDLIVKERLGICLALGESLAGWSLRCAGERQQRRRAVDEQGRRA